MSIKYPRIHLSGTDLLSRVGVIYSQILNDLLMKVDTGDTTYPKGFFHTSTNETMTPNYYKDMWSRDVGRGIIELCRAGLTEAAGDAIHYILSLGLNCGDHYGRLLGENPITPYEVDGNVNLLMGFFEYWKYEGKKAETGKLFLSHTDPVINWLEKSANECPYGFLLASKSELSGNPDTPFLIYAIYATYGACACLLAYESMAKECGDTLRADRYRTLADRFTDDMLKKLVSLGSSSTQNTKTPEGVWLNGLDEQTGEAAEIGDFGPKFPIHRWTRQLPFVLDYDRGADIAVDTQIQTVNEASYRYLREGMAQSPLFRRYGFVSCTCFTGMGGRHDDTMAGYGQNLFTQAALLSDDVNVYTKCIDGICRLAYDGDIVAPLTPDNNPWVMHECFTYENYEQGLDHTFGRVGDEAHGIMHNPGDEGNLVQSAETLKTFSVLAGITANGHTLCIKPRLPWECTDAQFYDFPVPAPGGTVSRISYEMEIARWKNEFTLSLSGAEKFDEVYVRIGPLPNVLINERELSRDWNIRRAHNAAFAERFIRTKGQSKINIVLRTEL